MEDKNNQHSRPFTLTKHFENKTDFTVINLEVGFIVECY